MLDGIVAIEHNRQTSTGPLFNELPDRFDDIFILVGAGIGCGWSGGGIVLGCFAAIAALMTAYVRALAGSLGLQQYFIGPMAKPHRMALLTLAVALSIIQTLIWHSHTIIMVSSLFLIIIGGFVTVFRRVYRSYIEIQK